MRYLIVIIGLIALASVLFPGLSREFLAVDKIENQTCDTLADIVTGLELQNLFGAKSTVLSIKDRKEVSRTASELICEGELVSSGGIRSRREYFIEENGDDFLYGVR